jgi:hypothetical protein
VPAEFGTQVDVGKGSIGSKLDGMVLVGTEGGNKVGGVVIEGVPQGDVLEEITLEVFFLRSPDLLTAFVDDSILVWVAVDGGGAGWGSKEVVETHY